MDDHARTSVVMGSYNCRGFNGNKKPYIANLLSECDILLLQEHWLSDAQLSVLGDLHNNNDVPIMYNGVSGFDNETVLTGRPYGGCAILWRSDMCANVVPIVIDSRRICAISLSSDTWKLLIINVYMPFENGYTNTDEFVYLLSVIEDIVASNGDCQCIIGGDFNVDFTRSRMHTAFLDRFCTDIGLVPADHHADFNVDYTYQFCMDRFSTLDHFLLSTRLYDTCVECINVQHTVDNISDHDPIFLSE